MGKSKPVKTSKKAPAPEGKQKAGGIAPAAKRPAAKKATAASALPAFTGIAIGHAAGEVWGILSSGEPRTIAELKKSVKAPGDVVVAAIGWLAREHKLEFVVNGKTVKIGLR